MDAPAHGLQRRLRRHRQVRRELLAGPGIAPSTGPTAAGLQRAPVLCPEGVADANGPAGALGASPGSASVSCRYLISLGASPEATTDSGEKPSDLIDPEYQDLVELFGATTMG